MNDVKIIFSVDDNINYYNFWKLNSEICNKILKLTPVLFHITDEETDFFEDKYGLVKKVKKSKNYKTSLQSQLYRMYGTKYFENDICIISDIDLILYNKSYLTYLLREFESCDLLIPNSDGYDMSRAECIKYNVYNHPRFLMTYNIALGKTFKNILLDYDTELFESFLERVFPKYEDKWSTDEYYFGERVFNKEHELVIKKLKRGYMSNFFLTDRIEKWNFLENNPWKLDLRNQLNYDKFIDCHFPSFNNNEDIIRKVHKEILNKYLHS